MVIKKFKNIYLNKFHKSLKCPFHITHDLYKGYSANETIKKLFIDLNNIHSTSGQPKELNTWVSESLHYEFKKRALSCNMTLQDYIFEMLMNGADTKIKAKQYEKLSLSNASYWYPNMKKNKTRFK